MSMIKLVLPLLTFLLHLGQYQAVRVQSRKECFIFMKNFFKFPDDELLEAFIKHGLDAKQWLKDNFPNNDTGVYTVEFWERVEDECPKGTPQVLIKYLMQNDHLTKNDREKWAKEVCT